MLHLLQIMNYMITKLEYSIEEVQEAFLSVELGKIKIDELLHVLGIEFGTIAHETLVNKFPKWRSALAVTKMRLESNE